MADLIKTVTDKSQFEFLLSNFYVNNTVYIKTSSGNMNLNYLGFSDGNVAFRIPYVKSIPDHVVVFVRYKTNTIYLSMKFLERSEDTFIFIPVKFQIISESRKEDRKLIGIEGGKSIIYINNLTSDYIIERALATADKKIDKVKEIAEFELKKKFDHVKIVFIHEAKMDARLKYVLSTSKSIFIPDLNVDPEPEDEEEFNNYVNNIYKADISISSRNKYASEITVPILYNSIIPYGYIQVNNIRALSDGLFEVCKRMAIVIDQLFKKNNLVSPITDKFLVSDLSKGGIGFVFKDKRILRYVQENSKICFDVMLPTKKKSVIGATVRNVSFLENRIIKVGSEIEKMDNISRSNYNEFIDLMK
jgi:hypothetical protein